MYATSLKQIESCRWALADAARKIADEQEHAKQEAELAEQAKAKVARLANY
jgi:hypothetical protein